MPLFSEDRFKWREPKAFLQFRNAEERASLRWWHRPLSALLVALIILAQWYVARYNPQKHPPSFQAALVMSISLGVFMAYIVPWIFSVYRGEVRLSDKYIAYVPGTANQGMKYVDMEYFGWRTIGGTTTLVLKKRKAKREVLLGAASEISKEDVHLFLLRRGLILQPGA